MRKRSVGQWITAVFVVMSSGLAAVLGGLSEQVGLGSATAMGFAALSFVCMILSAGIVLYWFRENWRLLYGCFEVVVGFALASREIGTVVYSMAGVFANEFLEDDANAPVFATDLEVTVFILQLIAGLYVIVRGLDNIGQSFRGKPAEKTWSWLSMKRVEKLEQK